MPLSPFVLLDRWLAHAPARERLDFLLRQPFAHRGLHCSEKLENCLPAFEAAIARGHGVECDVRLSRDGEAFVFHDDDLSRLTSETGRFGDRQGAELSGLRLKRGESGMPRLSDVIRTVGGRAPILIELKAPDAKVAPLCLAVRYELEGYRGPVAVMSFNPLVGHWFATHAPRIVRGLVITETGKKRLRGALERHLSLWRAKPDFLAYDVRDLPSRFAAAQRRRGLPVLTWTVRTDEEERVAAGCADQLIYEELGVEP